MSADITVVDKHQHIVVDAATKSVAVISTGPRGPSGLQGPSGPPGGSVLNGWWAYSTLTTGPASNGEVRTSGTLSGIDSTGTVWISSIDDQGLDWSLVTPVAGDRVVLRSITGEMWQLTINSVPTPGEWAVTLKSTTGGAPKKNQGVQVALIRALEGDFATVAEVEANSADIATAQADIVTAQTDATQAGVDAAAAQATADGKVDKAGDTMTGNLVLDSAPAPSIDIFKNDATEDTGRWRMAALNAGTDGAWYLQLRDDDGGENLGNAIIAWSDGTISLNTSNKALGTPVVEVPTISGQKQAAQVTAYDATTGQLAIGGIEVGDTGRRNIASLLSNGWTADEVVVRRSGNTVMLVVDTFAPGSGVDMLTLPNGFRPALNGARGVSGDVGSEFQPASNLGSQAVVSSGGVLRHQAIAPVNAWQLTMTWLTTDAWPVSLPGSAA